MVAQPDWAEDLAAIDAAARNAGIVPGDPGYAFVCGMTRVLDRFGQRLDAALKQLEDAPRQAPLELLAREATDAGDQHVASPRRYRNQLVRISTAWALTMLVGMGATYWAGYWMGSLRQRNSEQSALLPEPTTNASPATTAMTQPDAASGNTPQARAATEVSGPPIAMAADEARRREQDLKRSAQSATVAPPSITQPSPPGQAAAVPVEQGAAAKDKAAASSIMTAANVPVLPSMQSMPRGSSKDANQFQDCPQCPTMVRIPAGSFIMGQGAREPESMPAHHVEIRAFAIGLTPVTVAEWRACMAANGCTFLPRMRVAEDRTPVHDLSWDDVGQYVAWLSSVSGHAYRLPSEAEWEYAARGGTTTRYWWGDSVGMALANCADCGGAQDPYGPLPVDAVRPNPFGLLAMLGGVAQWTADCWFPNYHGAPSDGTPRAAKLCGKRVLRGGSFRSLHDEITATYRSNYDAPVRYLVNGFRVARDIN